MDSQIGASITGLQLPCSSIVLTYDDGPTEDGTEAILKELDARHATATFFVLLTRARRNPKLLHEILAAGHEVGLHGADHRRLTEHQPDALQPILTGARAELEDLTGVRLQWSRPPYGSQTEAVWRAQVASGLVPVLWSVECRDWMTLSLHEYMAPLRRQDLRGAIVLLHDGYADESDGAADGPAPHVDRALLTRSVLEEADLCGLTARSLGAGLEEAKPRYRIWLDEPS